MAKKKEPMAQHIRKKFQRKVIYYISVGSPLLIIACFAILARIDDLRLEVPLLIFMTALITILLGINQYLAENHFKATATILKSPVAILGVALIIRLFFLCQPVQLSDDLFRYYTDGHQLISGHNPYAEPPEAITGQTPFFVSILSKVNHPELVTIYPPAAQFIFASGALFKSLAGMKAVFVVLDLATCLLLIGLLKSQRLPIAQSVLYAWNPLPVLEIASSGHVDGPAVFFIVLSLFLLYYPISGETKGVPKLYQPSPTLFSGFFFACAFLTKLFPIVFFPVFFIVSGKGRRLTFTTGFIIGGMLLSVPFLPDIFKAFETLGIYTTTWEFSGFLFRLIRGLTDSGMISRLFLTAGFALTIVFLSLRTGGTKGENPNFTKSMKACYGISLGYLLLTPTLHPWYALYLVLFLPFFPGPAGLIMSWAVFLGYYVLISYSLLGLWEENNLVPALIFSAPVLVKILCRWVSRPLINKRDGHGIGNAF